VERLSVIQFYQALITNGLVKFALCPTIEKGVSKFRDQAFHEGRFVLFRIVAIGTPWVFNLNEQIMVRILDDEINRFHAVGQAMTVCRRFVLLIELKGR